MPINRVVDGNLVELDNLGTQAEGNDIITAGAQTLRNTRKRILKQTAGQTVLDSVDIETANPLDESQAISYYTHTSQSYIEASGSVANAYIVEQVNSYSIKDQNNTISTIKQPSITSYVNGVVIDTYIATPNTGASTIALRYVTATATNPIVYSQATLSNIPIYKLNALNTYVALTGGELFRDVKLKYYTNVPDVGGAGFVIVSTRQDIIDINNKINNVNTSLSNLINGFIVSTTGVINTVNITSGFAICRDNSTYISYAGGTNILLTTVFGGAFAASTTYHMFIYLNTLNVPTLFISTSLTPTIAGILSPLAYRRIFSFITNASSQIIPQSSFNFGSTILVAYNSLVQSSTTAPGLGGTVFTLTVPTGINVFVELNFNMSSGNSPCALEIASIGLATQYMELVQENGGGNLPMTYTGYFAPNLSGQFVARSVANAINSSTLSTARFFDYRLNY